MGYRFYLGSLPKKGSRKFRNATLEELRTLYASTVDEDCFNESGTYFSVTETPGLTKLAELGKYPEIDEKLTQPYYKKYDNEDHHFEVASKEFLKNAIDQMAGCVYEMYRKRFELFAKLEGKSRNLNDLVKNISNLSTDDFTSEECETFMSLSHDMRYKVAEWKMELPPYNLEDNRAIDFITGSWKYEYAIFNLVYLYKTFNWKKNYLILYAY